MSEISQLQNLPDISFTDNLTMKEVEELTKGEFSQSMQQQWTTSTTRMM